jgi:tight adherence protein C
MPLSMIWALRRAVPRFTRRCVGVRITVECGTPLADVLRAQAQDVREAGRRAVMEQGGKKEIAMMIPVVFVVLPVTVLFAIYPGVAFLKLSI